MPGPAFPVAVVIFEFLDFHCEAAFNARCGLRCVPDQWKTWLYVTGVSKFEIFAGACSVATAIISGFKWVARILQPPPSDFPFHGLAALPRLQMILFVGVIVAVLHGVLWRLVQWVFHWSYKEGESLPHGGAAVALSLTMTVPLVCVPPLYGRLAHIRIAPSGYWIAASFVVAAAALGHLLLYGLTARRLRGLRNIIFPLDSPPRRFRAVCMEFVYALIHFSSIVLIYRLVISSRGTALSAGIFFPAVISAAFWVFSVIAFLFLYPSAWMEKGEAQVRGILNGLMLCITLIGGMLM